MTVKYNLIPGNIFVPYRLRSLFSDETLEMARAVVLGRGFDERIIGWFIKVT